VIDGNKMLKLLAATTIGAWPWPKNTAEKYFSDIL
jgi:hypothetical protein